jgi:hypothetical protein
MHFLQVLLAPAAEYREQEDPECGHNHDQYADVIRRRVRFSKSIANNDFRQCEPGNITRTPEESALETPLRL